MLSLKYLEGTYNPVGRPSIFDCPNKWTQLQREIVVGIANAKFDTFSDAVEYVSGLLSQGLVTKQDAVDVLHEVALYNALYAEYRRDKIQCVIGDAFKLEAAYGSQIERQGQSRRARDGFENSRRS